MRHERDAAVVSALCLVTLLMNHGNTAYFTFGGIFPSRQMRVVSRWSSRRIVRSCWSPSLSNFTGRPSGPTAFAFVIASFIAVAISSSVDSIPSALVTAWRGSLFGMSRSSMWELAFNSEQKNRTHLSRIHLLYGTIFPSLSWPHCDSTFFISSSCTNLMFCKNQCWSLMRNCVFSLTTWRAKKQTTASLRTLFSPLHAFLTALRSCASLVFD